MLLEEYKNAPFRRGLNIVDAPNAIIQYARDNEWNDEDYKNFFEEFEEDNIQSF
jgi:hypothetical protein